MNMKVVLKENVANLGNIGDIVSVKPGFARNLLIPHKMAVQATEENIKAVEAHRAQLEKKEAERLQLAQKRAEQLQQASIKIIAKASDEGKLFGSISARDIAEVAEKAGIELHKNEVKLPQGPLRMTGEHEVDVVLHAKIACVVKVLVEAEK